MTCVGSRQIPTLAPIHQSARVGLAVASGHQETHLWPAMAAEGVGDRIRRFRRARRLTQEQLSERSGVRRDYIGLLESGATQVPRDPDNLKLLAKALGVRLRDLAEPTGWYDDEKGPDDWLAGLRADARLSDEDKDFIERAAQLAFDRLDREKRESPT